MRGVSGHPYGYRVEAEKAGGPHPSIVLNRGWEVVRVLTSRSEVEAKAPASLFQKRAHLGCK